jgi:hypothetical protein
MRAPVAVFAYSRLEELRRTLASLQRCHGIEARPIYLFVDGPKGETDLARVEAVRQFVSGLGWLNLEVRLSERNRGLRRSIMAGVSELVETHGRVIVVEDDLLLAPLALEYFEAGLERFGAAEQVQAVCGYMYRMPPPPDDRAFFLPFASSWGWATWRRAWQPFAANEARLLGRADDPDFLRRFDAQEIIAASTMLKGQRAGLTDSWAILWNAQLAETGSLCLFPAETMVLNGGFATRGATHGSRLNPINSLLRALNRDRRFARSFSLPEAVAPSETRRRAVAGTLESRLHRLSAHLGTARRRARLALAAASGGRRQS